MTLEMLAAVVGIVAGVISIGGLALVALRRRRQLAKIRPICAFKGWRIARESRRGPGTKTTISLSTKLELAAGALVLLLLDQAEPDTEKSYEPVHGDSCGWGKSIVRWTRRGTAGGGPTQASLTWTSLVLRLLARADPGLVKEWPHTGFLPAERAVRYLLNHQNGEGGLGYYREALRPHGWEVSPDTRHTASCAVALDMWGHGEEAARAFDYVARTAAPQVSPLSDPPLSAEIFDMSGIRQMVWHWAAKTSASPERRWACKYLGLNEDPAITAVLDVTRRGEAPEYDWLLRSSWFGVPEAVVDFILEAPKWHPRMEQLMTRVCDLALSRRATCGVDGVSLFGRRDDAGNRLADLASTVYVVRMLSCEELAASKTNEWKSRQDSALASFTENLGPLFWNHEAHSYDRGACTETWTWLLDFLLDDNEVLDFLRRGNLARLGAAASRLRSAGHDTARDIYAETLLAVRDEVDNLQRESTMLRARS